MRGTFEYVKVRTVDEACRHLAEGEATVLAGGTDLLVEIRNGLRSPRLLVDCKSVETLDQLDVRQDEVTVGASVPLNLLIERKDVREAVPALSSAAASIGTYQLRNRATLIGNICNASPAADSAPVLLVLRAEVHICGASGSRTLPLRDFFVGVKKTALRDDELVTAITMHRPARLRTAFRKQQRIRGHDLAVVNVAGAYDPEERQLRLAVGSCAPTPLLLEPIPADRSNPRDAAVQAVEAAMRAVSPISDVRASADHRRAILPVLIRRTVEDLLGGGV